MDIQKMFRNAKKAGVANETKMWESVAAMDRVLSVMEEEHPEEYWHMMRDQHEILWGPHYDDEFSEHDVSCIHWTDKEGVKHKGAHWSREQVSAATIGMGFPSGTTECDKYVAFNSFYADMCKDLDETMIIKLAHRFYFSDEDAPDGKIWRYMRAMIM